MYREEKREAMREGKRKAEAVASAADSGAAAMDVVSPAAKSPASNGKGRKSKGTPKVKTGKQSAPGTKQSPGSSKKRKTAK